MIKFKFLLRMTLTYKQLLLEGIAHWQNDYTNSVYFTQTLVCLPLPYVMFVISMEARWGHVNSHVVVCIGLVIMPS